jgi:energy-coupling factor transporter ATP-binding protein EcfA2
MALLEVKDLWFTYPEEKRPALADVSFAVDAGEFVALCGPSGSGKSTLLRLLKPEISPYGRRSGAIFYDGSPLADIPPARCARDIGFVFQDPDNQIAMDRVLGELVFGLENLGMDTGMMRRRVAEIVHFFGLEPLLDRKTHELSGGQKQMVNLAAVLMMEPRILLLDEPTAQLDPVSAKDFFNMLRRMNEELGITVLIAEHRLEDVWPLADRVIMLEDGRLRHVGKPREVIGKLFAEGDESFIDYLPRASVLYRQFTVEAERERIPITVKEAKRWLAGLTVVEMAEGRSIKDPRVNECPDSDNAASVGRFKAEARRRREAPVLEARAVRFHYRKNDPPVLNHLSLKIDVGERLAIVGGNGTGKSTLIKTLAGLLTPQSGTIWFKGKKVKSEPPEAIGYLPQNPKLFFMEETVEAAYRHALERGGTSPALLEEYLNFFEIGHLTARHPYDLSDGELQKVVLVCLLLERPDVLLIDEPTKGLDPAVKKRFGKLLKTLNQEEGLTVVFVTHDIEFAAQVATRCAMMFRGEITAEGDPHAFFTGNAFYTTAVGRITRGAGVLEVLTPEEAKKRWLVAKDGS